MWNHIAHELTNMQKQGLHKDASKNKYLLFYVVYLFTMLHDIYYESLNDSGSSCQTAF